MRKEVKVFSMISAKTNLILSREHVHVPSYNTRNEEDDIIPWCRLELFRTSFIPDAVKQWKLLKVEKREAISINSFRKNLET